MTRYEVPITAGETDTVTFPVTHGAGGTAVLADEVATVRCSCADLATGNTVNSRSDQNVINANNGALSDGSFSWDIQAADTALVTSSSASEVHRAIFTFTLSDGQVRLCAVDLRISAPV